MLRPIHEYGADITAADVRAAVATVEFDDEAPGALRASDGVKGLLERLAIAANDPDLPDDALLAWQVGPTERDALHL